MSQETGDRLETGDGQAETGYGRQTGGRQTDRRLAGDRQETDGRR